MEPANAKCRFLPRNSTSLLWCNVPTRRMRRSIQTVFRGGTVRLISRRVVYSAGRCRGFWRGFRGEGEGCLGKGYRVAGREERLAGRFPGECWNSPDLYPGWRRYISWPASGPSGPQQRYRMVRRALHGDVAEVDVLKKRTGICLFPGSGSKLLAEVFIEWAGCRAYGSLTGP